MNATSPRPDFRRSRRILLWTVGLFFALQFVGGLGLDYLWPEIRFPLLCAMLDRLKDEPRTPDIVVLGSSRFQTSVDAVELTHELRDRTGDSALRVFHAAVGGSDAITMEHTLGEILSRGHTPRLVVIEMTPTTIARDTRWYSMHVSRQIRWDDSPDHLREILGSGEFGRFVLARGVPLFRHRYEIGKTLRRRLNVFPPAIENPGTAADQPRQDLSENAWIAHFQPRPLSDDERARCERGVELLPRELHAFAPTSNAIDALERMLISCRERNIRAIVVGAPVSAAYRAGYASKESIYKEILAAIERRHGVSFFDGHARLPDHHFTDSHHTTPIGGLIFSRALAREALAPLIGSPRVVPASAVSRPGS